MFNVVLYSRTWKTLGCLKGRILVIRKTLFHTKWFYEIILNVRYVCECALKRNRHIRNFFNRDIFDKNITTTYYHIKHTLKLEKYFTSNFCYHRQKIQLFFLSLDFGFPAFDSNQWCTKMVSLVGIRTHDLSDVSLLPLMPQDNDVLPWNNYNAISTSS
jgi:hypothetical protein